MYVSLRFMQTCAHHGNPQDFGRGMRGSGIIGSSRPFPIPLPLIALPVPALPKKKWQPNP